MGFNSAFKGLMCFVYNMSGYTYINTYIHNYIQTYIHTDGHTVFCITLSPKQLSGPG